MLTGGIEARDNLDRRTYQQTYQGASCCCLWMGCMVSLGVLGGNSVWMGEKDCHIPHIYRTEQALEQLYLPTNLPTTCCSGHGGARALSGDASVAGGPFAGCPPASLAGEPTRPVADRS